MKKLSISLISLALGFGTAFATMPPETCDIQTQQNATLAQTYAFENPIGSQNFEGFFHMYQYYTLAGVGGQSSGCNPTTHVCQYIIPVGCALASSSQPTNMSIWSEIAAPVYAQENKFLSEHQYDPNLDNGIPYVVCNYDQGQTLQPADCNVQYIR